MSESNGVSQTRRLNWRVIIQDSRGGKGMLVSNEHAATSYTRCPFARGNAFD